MFKTTNKEKILKSAGEKRLNKKEQTWEWQTSHQKQCKPRESRVTSFKYTERRQQAI